MTSFSPSDSGPVDECLLQHLCAVFEIFDGDTLVLAMGNGDVARAGERNPGSNACRKLARVFHLPPEEVFRQAGLLPRVSELTEEFERLTCYCHQINLRIESAW